MAIRRKKWAAIIAILLCGSLLAAGAVYLLTFQKAGIAETSHIYIDDDDIIDSVETKLSRVCDPLSMRGLELLKKTLDIRVRTGHYVLQPSDRVIDIFRKLKAGHQDPVSVIVPSVRTKEQLAASLGRQLMPDSAAWMDAFRDTHLLDSIGYTPATFYCLIIPNTYQVYWNTGTVSFIERMQKEYDAFWNSTRKAKAEAAGLKPAEVVTLASIIDEETNNKAEKPVMAGVYLNRLRKGMLLQACPTVKFAVGDFTLRRILGVHLQTDSPYNTYKYAGLPPGPIRIPSIAGIDAVLNYVQHDYLFFCAKEDFSGTHNFASTLKEHEENGRRYRAELNRRGIR